MCISICAFLSVTFCFNFHPKHFQSNLLLFCLFEKSRIYYWACSSVLGLEVRLVLRRRKFWLLRRLNGPAQSGGPRKVWEQWFVEPSTDFVQFWEDYTQVFFSSSLFFCVFHYIFYFLFSIFSVHIFFFQINVGLFITCCIFFSTRGKVFLIHFEYFLNT